MTGMAIPVTQTLAIAALLASVAAVLWAGERTVRLLLAARRRRVRPVRPASTWTRAERNLARGLIALGAAITVPAFALIYHTVTGVLQPSMHGWAWIVPVCGEIVFAFLFLQGILLAMRRAPGPAIRVALMGLLMLGSLILNVWYFRDSLPAAVGHAVVVTGFYGVLLAGKSTITSLYGGKVRPDRISAGEWLAHPLRSFALWRWMASWGEASREKALERYMTLLLAITLAQADERIGRRMGWRGKLPPPLRYQLATGTFPPNVTAAAEAAEGGWQEAIAGHIAGQLALLDRRRPEGTPGVTAEGTPDGSTEGSQEGRAEGSREGSSGGSRRGTRQGSSEGTPDRTGWPESRDIERAVLVRRTRTAMKRYTTKHPGKSLPATQLSDTLQIRMSRDTASGLLAEAAPKGDAPHRPSLHVAEG